MQGEGQQIGKDFCLTVLSLNIRSHMCTLMLHWQSAGRCQREIKELHHLLKAVNTDSSCLSYKDAGREGVWGNHRAKLGLWVVCVCVLGLQPAGDKN